MLLGLLGTSPRSSAIVRDWNRFLNEGKIDGSMDRYPCTEATIPERLSEMVHFDRRGYIVTPRLQQFVVPFMDLLDGSAQRQESVDTIVHEEGVIVGYWTNGDDVRRKELWCDVNSPRLVSGLSDR